MKQFKKITAQKILYIFNVSPKNRFFFYGWNFIFLIWNRVYSDRSGLDISDETIKISISVESYDEKSDENYRNC